MVQTNTFINKTLLLLLMALSLTAQAQRFGVKPFIGASYNSLRIINVNNLLFTDAGFGSIRPTLGIMLSYEISPKIGIEFAQLNSPTVYSYEAFHPVTKNNIAKVNGVSNELSWLLNCSYTIKRYDHVQYKIIGGLEFPIKKRRPIIGSVSNPTTADTNFISFTDATIRPTSTPNKFQEVFRGINIGIGQEYLIRKKVVAELRLSMRYAFLDQGSTSIAFKQNGDFYTNQLLSRRTTFNVTAIVNLSTLLGTKWSKTD